MRTQPGFSLLELVIVLTIMGIAALMLMPQLDMRQVKVNATSRSLTMFILSAQQRAVLSQRNVMVVFDTAASRVTVHEDSDNDGVRDAGERQRSLDFESGVRFTRGLVAAGPPGDSIVNMRSVGGVPMFTYRRNGSASESVGFYIGTERSGTSSAYASDVRGYTVERGTGQVVRWVVQGGQWRREGL